MKKSTYLIALALGASTITFAQNVGINTDGSDPDANTILHIKNHSGSSLDSTLLRIENEKATTGTGVQIENSGTASSKWDVFVPGSSTDLRIKGNGSDHVTIQNDGDVGIGTTTPVSGLDIQTSMGLKLNTITGATTLDQTHNVILSDNGPYTVTLPAAASNTDRVYYIKNIDAEGDDITIDGNSTETIDGSETYVLDCENDVIRIISNGSNWFILDRDTGTCAAAFTCGTSTVSWTYNGGSVTYGTVLSSTGECWMDRNLGASQVATSSTDYLAYGDLFQWGRADDGHQEITWTNSTTGSAVNGTTSTNADTPGDALFITVGSSPYDWRSTQDANLWNGESATNNPCPSGWRIPTETEWDTERTTDFTSNNAAGAFGSSLKLPMAGNRKYSDGSLTNVGTYGYYWSSTVSGTNARYLRFISSTANMYTNNRAYGYSVRCIKD